jgi:4-amino-4-deoxy-L-arabinose transferase-like glycosyltransferase
MLSIEIAIILLIFLICIFNQNNNYNIATLIIYAFIFRLILLIIDLYIYKIPFSTLDSNGFELKAAQWGEGGLYYSISNFSIEGKSFTYSNILSIFYSVFGRSIFLAKLLSIISSLLSILLMYKILKIVWGNQKQAIISCIFLSFMPLYALITTLTLRETFIVLILLLSLLFYLIYETKNNILFFYLSLIVSYFHIFLHGPMSFLVITLLITYLIFNLSKIASRNYLYINSFYLTIMIFIFFIFIIYKLQILIEIPYIGSITNTYNFLEIIQNNYNNTAYGRTVYSQIFYPENYYDIIILSPLRVLNFLCGPLLYSNAGDFITLLDSILYIFLFFLIFRNIKLIFSNAKIRSLIIVILPLVLIYSWGVNNYGTSLRHKIKFLPILIILSSPYIYSTYTYALNKIKFFK